MKRLTQLRATTTAVRKFWYGILHENHGQDMIEYALMAGFLAVAAAVFMPTFTSSIAGVFTRIGTTLAGAGV